MLLGMVATLTSCSEDRDSNPNIQTPTTFNVNTPALADQYIQFRCPKCNFDTEQDVAVKTRNNIRRKHICTKCGAKFITIETVETFIEEQDDGNRH